MPAMIVADDQSLAEEVAVSLGFLGLRSEIVSVPSSPASHGEAEIWSAVILCGQAAGSTLQALDGWANGPPVIVVDQPQSIPGHFRSLHGRLLGRVERPLRNAQLMPLLGRLGLRPSSPRDVELFRSMVGKSEPIQNVRRMIGLVAPTDSTVLILGETGTGKEVAARHIHYKSHRRDGPFVAVNCGAIPADLLESELFGHEKGAFTGALTARKGRFELAENGTLFLDEIGDMSMQMQVKLLRVLQERVFERLGSGRTMPANVRIVCATHRDLDQMVAAGTFRGDLYYRINVFPIEMPALRERREDLPLLATELVARLAAEGHGAVKFTPEALAAMSRHDWPGNVRELANLIERLAILHPGEPVRLADLPRHLRALGVAGEGQTGAIRALIPDPFLPDSHCSELAVPQAGYGYEATLGMGKGLKDYLNSIEEQLIRKALAENSGTVADAAKSLGMRRTTLVEKLRKFGINRIGFATES